MAQLHRVCVFTGSSPGGRPDYEAAARSLGEALATAGVGLVYGGAHVGLMGALADAARAAGGHVVGVIPESLVSLEVAHEGLDDLRVVGSMHERKAVMASLSDAFVALPGGLGTLEELFEIWTWAQLGFHGKPLGLLDAGGYFDRLIDFLDHAVEEGFVRVQHRELLATATDAGALLAALEERAGAGGWRPTAKWLDQAG